MEAIIRTNDRNLFYPILQFLKSLHFTVETEDEKIIEKETKKFNPSEYRGMLRHLNLNIEAELQNMRNAWKKRNF